MASTVASRLAEALRGSGFDEHDAENAAPAASIGAHAPAPGCCCECGDQPFVCRCAECAGDEFCTVCFAAVHRGGSRRGHVALPAVSPLAAAAAAPSAPLPPSAAAAVVAPAAASTSTHQDLDSDADDDMGSGGSGAGGASTVVWAERARYIPLRLHYVERRMLRLVEAALNVSEYTDKVDVAGGSSTRVKRIHEQLKSLFAILCGLLVAEDFEAGKALIVESDATGRASFYQAAFELVRRYKILNPERLRADYGKLLYLLQDSRIPEVADLLGFDLVRPIVTVHSFLAERGPKALELLNDPLLPAATKTITSEGRPRYVIDADIKRKERAIEVLAKKYAFGEGALQRVKKFWYSFAFAYPDDDEDASSPGGSTSRLTSDDIKHLLYSISDNNTFTVENVVPVEKMLHLLESNFSPDTITAGSPSLAIYAGTSGARLTHSHPNQYAFVRQSLVLWRAILRDFFQYWMTAEADFLNPALRYRLMDTGQGLNRVQNAPGVAKAMSRVLHECQSACGGWVGSSVVHLGDHNVPNAFVFLDKYTQVSRILSPIVLVIETIPVLLAKQPSLLEYVRADFGSEQGLVVNILGDFFRHGFDGSGADNFMDAGSCIDGRLTSAWEWASKIDKKIYAPVFKLCSMLGFDGRFER